MVANAKPGVDWRAIKRRYEAGENPSAIATSLAGEEISITRQAITKKANREGWQFDAANAPQDSPQAVVPARKVHAAPLVPLTPELEEAVLEEARKGRTRKTVARVVGVTPATLDTWLEASPEFARKAEQAEGQFIARMADCVVDAADRGDWKAGQWLLETHPASREEYGRQKESGNGGMVVKLKFDLQRGAIPRDEDIIEIETIG